MTSKPAAPEAPLDYAETTRLARHSDADVRRTLAARTDIPAEILYFLSADPDAGVRQVIAENSATPRQAHLLLAKDQESAVRCSLAEKLGTLFPDLSNREKSQLHDVTLRSVRILAQDQMVRVREILADALKDLPQAPADVIHRFARDSEIQVAGPVLEHSPIFTDQDLIELVSAARATGAVSAIARRETVSDAVSDAVVASDDRAAITDLLANQGAQIREETLDDLIQQAEAVTDWHMPLVNRPKLSSQGIFRLAQFVADTLLDSLQNRTELDHQMAQQLGDAIRDRLSHKNAPAADAADTGGAPPSPHKTTATPTWEDEHDRASRLIAENALTEAVMAQETAAGNRHFVLAALSLTTRIPEPLVRQTLTGRNAKTIVALCWKSGFSMQVAEALQTRFSSLEPYQIVKAKKEDGSYPLSESAMIWQIDLLADLDE